MPWSEKELKSVDGVPGQRSRNECVTHDDCHHGFRPVIQNESDLHKHA